MMEFAPTFANLANFVALAGFIDALGQFLRP